MARPKTTPKKSAQQPLLPRPRGKLGELLDSIESKKGARLGDISKTLKWQPHTTRAAITRLRQRGHAIVLEKDGAERFYKIDGVA